MTGKWRILRGLAEEQGISTTVAWAISRTTAQIGGNLTHQCADDNVPLTRSLILVTGMSECFEDAGRGESPLGHFADNAVAEGPFRAHNYGPMVSEPDRVCF